MAITIQMKRGLFANLASAGVLAGEPKFVTDKGGQLYVGNGSANVCVSNAIERVTALPSSNIREDKMYFLSADAGDYVKGTYVWDGSAWVSCGITNYELLDNLPTINGVDVKGDLTSADLGLVPEGRKVAGLKLDADITATALSGALADVTENLTNKTIDADDNTITDLAVSNFKSGVVATTVAAAASAVDTKVATEKAIRTAIDSAVSTKADTTYVDAQLALKADKTEVETELALKADKSEVETALALKADTSYVDTQLGLKADKSTTYTKTETDAAIATAIEDKADKATTLAGYGITNAYTKTEVDTAIGAEATAREAADDLLQEQIDAIEAKADVVDVVATKAALLAYDTSKLFNNDVVKVLKDESRSNAVTYYRWSKPETGAGSWVFVGELGPFYTVAEVDALLNNKADASDLTEHIADTSNPHGVTKAQVGLGNVDNTSDANKPISTATQAALDLKADAATTLAGYGITDAKIENGVITLGSASITPITDVSDKADKADFDAHVADVSNPHSVTKAQVGLGNVDNTSDLNKPISTATQAALDLKADDADVTAALALKADITYVDDELEGKADVATTLAGYGITDAKIENGVITLGSQTITPLTEVPVASDTVLGGVKQGSNVSIDSAGVLSVPVDSTLSTTSTAPVQNKVINTALGDKIDKVQGSENAGKLFAVGAGGSYTLIDTIDGGSF